MRDLWSDHEQPKSLVRDPVRRLGTYGAQMEHNCGQRTGSSSLLWGSPRRRLYQPLVRFGVLAAETRFRKIGHWREVACADGVLSSARCSGLEILHPRMVHWHQKPIAAIQMHGRLVPVSGLRP